MIPETMYDTSLETWELVLPEDEAGCESPRGCSSAATWRLTNACCGAQFNLCDPHRRVEDEVLSVSSYCKPCGAVDAGVRWHRI